jgi:hypothetical protein
VTTETISVFLSYKWGAESENAWVMAFASDLRHAGLDVKLDRWEVRAGDSFIDYMAQGIANAPIVMFVITEASTEAAMKGMGRGGGLSFEMQIAAARRIADEEFRLIPIFRQGKGVPAHLLGQRYIDFRDDGQYHRALSELLTDVLAVSSKPPLGGRQYREILARIASLDERLATTLRTVDRLLSTEEGRTRGSDVISNYSESISDMQRSRKLLLAELKSTH